jgi:hypothetical protein
MPPQHGTNGKVPMKDFTPSEIAYAGIELRRIALDHAMAMLSAGHLSPDREQILAAAKFFEAYLRGGSNERV